MGFEISDYNIAVLVPCYNEAGTIRDVIFDVKKHLPSAKIFIYDNNSTDETISEATLPGVCVSSEKKQGKGSVVKRMFTEIDADIYIMIDGDATYDISNSPKLAELLIANNLDMINVARVESDKKCYKFGRKIANVLFNKLLDALFGSNLKDALSGYKIFDKRFVKSFPAISSGFEIETEMVIFAIKSGYKISEYSSAYYPRPEDSKSKLNFFNDGAHIFKFVFLKYIEKLIPQSVIIDSQKT